MTVWQSIILGVVQGLTEFLPISSSGHLVLVPFLLNWEIPAEEAFIFDVLVQVATLVAVLAFFRQDYLHIVREMIQGIFQRTPFEGLHARLGWFILIATIPGGIAGILLKDIVERAFNSPLATSLSFD